MDRQLYSGNENEQCARFADDTINNGKNNNTYDERHHSHYDHYNNHDNHTGPADLHHSHSMRYPPGQ